MMGMTLPNSTFKNGLNISLKILKAHYKRRKKKKRHPEEVTRILKENLYSQRTNEKLGGWGEKKKKNTYSVQSTLQWGTEEGGGAHTPAAAPGLRPNMAPLRPVTSPSMGFSLSVLPHPLSGAELPRDQGEGHIKGLARPPE